MKEEKHSHHHDPSVKKKELNRLSKTIGHLNKVSRMIENDADCAEVLIQLSACRGALNSLGKEIINEHLKHCIAHAIEDGDTEMIDSFQEAVKKFY